MRELPRGWRFATVDDVRAPAGASVAIGPFGSRLKAARYVDLGVAVIRGMNLSATRSFHGELAYVSEATASEFASSQLRPYDLVFPHRGAIGQVGLVPEDAGPCMLSTSLMKLTCDRDVADPIYVFYFFRSDAGRREILKYASTVGTPGIGQPLASLRSMRLPLPPLAEQRAIAEVLGALDDKIDGNERLIASGEALLRAKFDRLAELASDRPTQLVGMLCNNVRDAVKPADVEDSTPYVGLEHMPRGSVVVRKVGLAADVSSGKALFRSRDILFGKLRPYFRKVALADAAGVCSSDILVLRPFVAAHLPFSLMLTSSQRFIDYCEAASSGTRMPRVSWADMARYQVTVPDDRGLVAFNDTAAPLLDRMMSAVRESSSLAALRDALLPPLMSGELRVRDPEGVMADAT